MEREDKSISESGKEVKWIKCILEEWTLFLLFEVLHLSATIYDDKMSVIQFASSLVVSQRIKYIEIQLHFTGNLIKGNLF